MGTSYFILHTVIRSSDRQDGACDDRSTYIPESTVSSLTLDDDSSVQAVRLRTGLGKPSNRTIVEEVDRPCKFSVSYNLLQINSKNKRLLEESGIVSAMGPYVILLLGQSSRRFSAPLEALGLGTGALRGFIRL